MGRRLEPSEFDEVAGEPFVLRLTVDDARVSPTVPLDTSEVSEVEFEAVGRTTITKTLSDGEIVQEGDNSAGTWLINILSGDTAATEGRFDYTVRVLNLTNQPRTVRRGAFTILED